MSKFPQDLTIQAIRAEVMRARALHPSGAGVFLNMLAALMEEVGELAQAYLQHKPVDELEKEAIQVACVAVRIVEESLPGLREVSP